MNQAYDQLDHLRPPLRHLTLHQGKPYPVQEKGLVECALLSTFTIWSPLINPCTCSRTQLQSRSANSALVPPVARPRILHISFNGPSPRLMSAFAEVTFNRSPAPVPTNLGGERGAADCSPRTSDGDEALRRLMSGVACLGSPSLLRCGDTHVERRPIHE